MTPQEIVFNNNCSFGARLSWMGHYYDAIKKGFCPNKSQEKIETQIIDKEASSKQIQILRPISIGIQFLRNIWLIFWSMRVLLGCKIYWKATIDFLCIPSQMGVCRLPRVNDLIRKAKVWQFVLNSAQKKFERELPLQRRPNMLDKPITLMLDDEN